MNILFEVNHPGHIHLFRNLYFELSKREHDVLFLIKSDQVTEMLAEFYELPTLKMGKKGKGLLQKYWYQVGFLYKTISIARKRKASLGMGVSMTLPLVSKLTGMKSIGFDDDDMAVTPVFAKYANKASVILTPSALAFDNRGPHHISYPGYHELAYLHPNRFSPDPKVFDVLGISPGVEYFLLRFNSFDAHHDVGEHGMTYDQKKQLIEKLKNRGRVFLSTETVVDPAFKSYQIPRRPEMMHSILAYAKLYVGESQTMTSEAAILGTPALKCNTFAGRLSIPNELENEYGLCYSYLPADFGKVMDKLDELLAMPDLKEEWQRRRMKLLKEKLDVTGFLTWFVENFPGSTDIVKRSNDTFFDTWKND